MWTDMFLDVVDQVAKGREKTVILEGGRIGGEHMRSCESVL